MFSFMKDFCISNLSCHNFVCAIHIPQLLVEFEMIHFKKIPSASAPTKRIINVDHTEFLSSSFMATTFTKDCIFATKEEA